MPRLKREAIIKLRLKEIVWEGMDFFHLVELWLRCSDGHDNKPELHERDRRLLISKGATGLSKRALFF